MSKHKKAFSLAEALIGMFMLAVIVLSFFAINHTSSTQSLDAYYEFLAQTLGNEVIEFCRGMGYEWANKYIDAKNFDLFPLNEWHGVLEYPLFRDSSYFSESSYFERRVTMTRLNADSKGILVLAEIRVKNNNKAKIWLSKNNVTFSLMLLEKPIR